MASIRVLVVDDAVIVRRLLSDVLAADPDIEVVGTAATGKIGLAKIEQLQPDLVTLDVEMPGMSGLETLAAIRKLHPRLPVIMFSSMTERGAATTLDALAMGANDYVTKPAGAGSLANAMRAVREQLVPKVKALCTRSVPRLEDAVPRARPPLLATTPFRAIGRRIDAVAIGVSTGGPNALGRIIPELPRDFPVPVLIVQHMPPLFTTLLAQRLAQTSRIEVVEGVAGEPLRPGRVWIAPGDHHMGVRAAPGGASIDLNRESPENSCRPAVDVLFRSVAALFGPSALAVVLTGMGRDGLRGCESIHEAGGQVLVQDEATSVVWGMPGFVAHAGLADEVLPLDEIGPKIVRLVKRPHASGAALGSAAAARSIDGGTR